MEMGQSNKHSGHQPPDYSHLPQYSNPGGPHQPLPQYGYNPPVIQMQPEPAQTIIINNNVNVGPDPTSVICPSCRSHVVTRLDYESTTRTHIIAGLLCLFLCWPCVCIPYCTTCCRNANHYCPSCGAFLGSYNQ